MESLLGAIYLHHGIDTAREVILRLFGALLDTAPTLGAGLDWKTSLQELTAARGLGAPSYQVTSTGPDHHKEFTAVVVVMDTEYGSGVGRSKKEAEQQAAAAAWKALNVLDSAVTLDARTTRGRGGAARTAGPCGGQDHHRRPSASPPRGAPPRGRPRRPDGAAAGRPDHRHRPARQVSVADAGRAGQRRAGARRSPRHERTDAARRRCRAPTMCGSRRCSTTAPR